MTDKQKTFAEEYLKDLNATRAYKETYRRVKSDDVAAANGSRLLRNAKVAAYIEKQMARRSERTQVSQDEVVKELAKIGFSRTGAVDELEMKIGDKLKALELLGRHLGMFTDKQEVTATVSYEEYFKGMKDYEY